jgi:hypothetical protein
MWLRDELVLRDFTGSTPLEWFSVKLLEWFSVKFALIL